MSEEETGTVQTKTHDFKIVLVRHGQAGGEERPGKLGPPLTPLGKKQAARVAKRLAEESFSHIYASDLSRAHYTALAICKFHPETPFTVTEVLREINGSMITPGRAPGDRAAHEDIRKRRAEIQEFVRQLLRKHTWNDQILIVAHGDLIRFLVYTLAGVNPKKAMLFETSNTSVNEAIIQNGKFLWMYRTNDVHHLLPQQIT